MSYVFDTLSRVWNRHIRPLVVRDGKEILAFEFESLLEELHDANHRLKDAVNHDPGATKAARELDEYAKALEAVAEGDPVQCCGGPMAKADDRRWKCGVCGKLIMV